MIRIAGQDNASLTGGLLDLRIDEAADGLYACEATFGNWGPRNGSTGFLYFDRQTLDFGKELEIRLGTETIFRGLISALDARFPDGDPPRICVLAEDRLQALRMTRRTRTYLGMSDADVFQKVANDHGLTPDVNVTGPTHKVLSQLDLSDLAFLRERARAIDAELWVEGATLKVQQRTARNGGSLTLGYGNKLRELNVSADLAHQRTSVRVGGWDVSAKDALEFDATESAVSAELNGGESGSSVLSSALGERKEAVAHAVPLNLQEAQLRAESLYRVRARRFVSGRGVGETTSKLRVGAHARLTGVGPLFEGEYYVTWVRHLFDGAAGLRTEFGVERPGLGRP
jgi:phage protein D